jgi:glycosyltransferase involved in cell wall biosynthesis
MRILMVVHQFLPRHLAGSEVYTYRLAQALGRRGHQVQLFFTEIRPDRPQYELTRGEFDGIPYFEAVHNRVFASFRHSYRDPNMERLFQTVLDATSPELIHAQHLHLHSTGYIAIARRRGLPVLYTLHEYMLMCLNGGLLLRPGAILCDGPEIAACARCAAVVYPDVPAEGESSVLRARVRRLAARVRRVLGTPAEAGHNGGAAYLDAVRRRRREIQEDLDQVNLFVAPSRYLQRQFVTSGMIRPERIVHSDYGFHVAPFVVVGKRASPTLRVGYIGTIAEFKGVHLILEAFRDMHDAGIECRIYGDLDIFPDYKQTLLRHGTPAAVRFMGRLENERVADALGELDLLIVPSLWPENSPLTIHEAQLAGIPVLTADCGGMAELVAHGKSGLLFRTGDAADLRRQLLRVLREPALLTPFREQRPAVKTIEEDAAQMEHRYRSLLQGQTPVH